LKELGFFSRFVHAIGLRFPKVEEGKQYLDLKKTLMDAYIKRPLVIFIEGTKTNGRGVLEPSHSIVEEIVNFSLKNRIHVHSLKFNYIFTYSSPYNTTDRLGFKTLFQGLSQVHSFIFYF
jgi:hypothetical protein